MRLHVWGAAVATVAIASSVMVPPPVEAAATAAGSGLLISEVYGGGGMPGAAYNSDFVELYNTSDGAITLNGLYLNYRTAKGVPVAAPAPLSGTLGAHRHFLVRMTGIHKQGTSLPTPDLVAAPKQGVSSRGGQVLLLRGGTPFTTIGNLVGNSRVVDMVGIGSSNSYETQCAPNTTSVLSVNRGPGAPDTNNNKNDFTLAYPSPVAMEPAGSAAVSTWTTPATTVAGASGVRVQVAVPGSAPQPTGSVTIRLNGLLVDTVKLSSNGTATALLGRLPHAGIMNVDVRYTGDGNHSGAAAKTWHLPVDRCHPALTAIRSPKRVHAHQGPVRFRAVVAAPGVAITGKVRFQVGRHVEVRGLNSGVATAKFGGFSLGRHRLRVTYLGNHDARPVTKAVAFRVRR